MCAWRPHHHCDLVPQVGSFKTAFAFCDIGVLRVKTPGWHLSHVCRHVINIQGLRIRLPDADCSRNLEEGESELKKNEKYLLDLICKAYYLPQWCSINDYRRIFEAQGLQVHIC